VGLPEALLSGPGLGSSLRPEFALPLVTSTGPLGEMSVLPPQLEFSEIKLGPRFSGDPNGASKLDWSVFSTKNENKAEAR